MTDQDTPEPKDRTLNSHWEMGKVFQIQSDKFGTHDVLCVKAPGEARDNRMRALPIHPDGQITEILYMSSVENDTVLKSWPNLRAYYADSLAQGATPTKTITATPA